MSNKPLPLVFQPIVDILKRSGHGLKISDIEAELPSSIARRTLQRYLTQLGTQKIVKIHGIKSARKYFLSSQEFHIKLSKAAQHLKSLMEKPIAQRKPVAYNTEFLFSYIPNKTFYLTEKMRVYLFEIGKRFQQKLEPGTFAKRILHRLLIDLSWNSSRLEGNTYSLLETEKLIEYGAEAEGKDALEAQMIVNHKEAIEFMVEQISLGINKYMVYNIHALLSQNLLANSRACGQLRQIIVGIGNSVYHPLEIPQVIAECFEAIIDKAQKINDPFEQAFFLMVHLPYLQPFEDVNKRVSRLAVNIPLMQHNLSPLSFIDVPKKDYISSLLAVYELNKIEYLRDVFMWAYERSSQHYQLTYNTLGEPNLVALRYRTTLHELIKQVVSQNLQGKNILQFVENWAKERVETKHQKEFTLYVEREIAGLHEGNIAIYRISPEMFSKWRIK
ncbi:MAG: hypothetical protein A3H51_02375 [Candidatus Spechtbacteria bacterium RIFCSPLOWO2_02_FULL_38_8]|uniref:Fido domain-containing protein n=1 Tax=Candidatus Spechtbacteria bacterium RIFCSPLOWO2_02_FULL_38_8 TaxID=1802164 RepID=A0A1G2HHV3_9BACT|nr:MAG: hypothetical protein A3H51_02375 [Candidatus Spechtbacteria bacterium RIFCSPLOWO2_02_FULL_38_8]